MPNPPIGLVAGFEQVAGLLPHEVAKIAHGFVFGPNKTADAIGPAFAKLPLFGFVKHAATEAILDASGKLGLSAGATIHVPTAILGRLGVRSLLS